MIIKRIAITAGIVLHSLSFATSVGEFERTLSAEGVMEHLLSLQQIAMDNNGHRAAGTDGHTFSANYISQKLLAAGYEVKLIPFDFDQFNQLETGVLNLALGDSTETLVDTQDFNIMSFSGSGAVTAKAVAVDLDLGEGNKSSSGCEVSDFENFPAGAIALIQRGACSFAQKAENASKAGAVAALIFNQGNEPTRKELLQGTLGESYDRSIPVFGLNYERGVALSESPETEITVSAKTEVANLITYNVVAETPGGNPDNVVMLGAHMDSVPAGPGINDNGSGSAGILEVAIKMMEVIKASDKPYNKLRFAWWSAEEVGLIGSARYVESLDEDSKARIAMYLNFDMIGSKNYKLGVFDADGDTHGQEGPEGSAAIEQFFQMYYTLAGTKSTDVELSGRSDYAPFAEVGIPVGGLFTGAEGTKTEAEAGLYGGVAGEAYDACYHKVCDTVDMINMDALEVNVNAIGFAALTYAYSTYAVNGTHANQRGISGRLMTRKMKRNQVRFERSHSAHCGHEHDEI